MKITVEIDCETINEFDSHLLKLREQIRDKAKKLKLNPLNDEFPKGVKLSDNNCYGSHSVKFHA